MALLLDCVFTGAPAGNLESFVIPGYPNYSWVKTTASDSLSVGASGVYNSVGPEGTIRAGYVVWDNVLGAAAEFVGPLTVDIFSVADVAGTVVVWTGRQDTEGLLTYQNAIGISGGVEAIAAGQVHVRVGDTYYGAVTSQSTPFGSIGYKDASAGCKATLRFSAPGVTAYQFNDIPEGAAEYLLIDPANIVITASDARPIQRIRIYNDDDPSGGGGGESEPKQYWWKSLANSTQEAI